MKKTLLSIPLLPLIVSSCQVSNQGMNTIYLSGEIVNPKEEFVILYQGDQVVDSAWLDAGNRFTFILPELNDGLYHFYHYPQQQYVYLQKGDSLRIRLNTQEFDESLSFSGHGAGINNFLISMFLAYETEAEVLNEYYVLEPEEFTRKMDELRASKQSFMTELADKERWSPAAVRMARAAIDFDNFVYREKYPFYHRRSTGKTGFHRLPDSFYSYRQDLNINNRELSYFRPYYEFMKYHIGNLSYMRCLDVCQEGAKRETAALHLGKHKIQLIDSLVQESTLRNNLLRTVAMDYLLQNPRLTPQGESFFKAFYATCTNELHKLEIAQLHEGIRNLQTNSLLPGDIQVLDHNEEWVNLREQTFTQPVVFYFWTANQEGHLANQVKRVRILKENNSEYKYIGIALRTSKAEWRSAITQYDLEPSEQFLGVDFDQLLNKLVIESLNKCIVAKDGRVIDGFANIHHPLPTISQKGQFTPVVPPKRRELTTVE